MKKLKHYIPQKELSAKNRKFRLLTFAILVVVILVIVLLSAIFSKSEVNNAYSDKTYVFDEPRVFYFVRADAALFFDGAGDEIKDAKFPILGEFDVEFTRKSALVTHSLGLTDTPKVYAVNKYGRFELTSNSDEFLYLGEFFDGNILFFDGNSDTINIYKAAEKKIESLIEIDPVLEETESAFVPPYGKKFLLTVNGKAGKRYIYFDGKKEFDIDDKLSDEIETWILSDRGMLYFKEDGEELLKSLNLSSEVSQVKELKDLGIYTRTIDGSQIVFNQPDGSKYLSVDGYTDNFPLMDGFEYFIFPSYVSAVTDFVGKTYVADGNIYIIGDDYTSRLIAQNTEEQNISTDGKWLAYTIPKSATKNALYKVDLRNDKISPEYLLTADETLRPYIYPGGRRISVFGDEQVYSVKKNFLGDDKLVSIVHVSRLAEGVVYAISGNTLYYSSPDRCLAANGELSASVVRKEIPADMAATDEGGGLFIAFNETGLHYMYRGTLKKIDSYFTISAVNNMNAESNTANKVS